jgi:uncharacterized membrane protein YqiK
MEEIFTEREEFKRRIFRNIQSELDQFGLKIYNANVKELRDAPNSNYFESLSRKAHEGAINQARIVSNFQNPKFSIKIIPRAVYWIPRVLQRVRHFLYCKSFSIRHFLYSKIFSIRHLLILKLK